MRLETRKAELFPDNITDFFLSILIFIIFRRVSQNAAPFSFATMVGIIDGSVSIYEMMSDSGEEKHNRLQKSFPKPLQLIDFNQLS